MKERVRLEPRDKGCALVYEDGMTLATLSWMDAAKFLFQFKGELQRSSIGRGCLDSVAEMRRRAGS